MKTTKRNAWIGLLAGLALLAAACGSDAADTSVVGDTEGALSPTTAAETSAEPEEGTATTEAPDEDAEAQRIVSLSPTATEMMFAIGAGDQLVAVDTYSNFPAETAELPNELAAFEPNVEAIAEFEPDLVLVDGSSQPLLDQLAALDIETWQGPAASSMDDIYAQLEQLGAATGEIAGAAEVVLDMQTRLEAVDAQIAAEPLPGPLSFYHELDSTLYSIDSTTFIGAAYERFGLTNIADAASGDSGGYPQLNAEYIISSDPDIIFLTDGEFADTADALAGRDGWADIAAVQNGNVISVDTDIASRWGPRTVDYIERIAEALASLNVPVPVG